MTESQNTTWRESIAAAAADMSDRNPKLCAARASSALSLLNANLSVMFDAIEDADLSSGTASDLRRLAEDLRALGNDGMYLAERFGDE